MRIINVNPFLRALNLSQAGEHELVANVVLLLKLAEHQTSLDTEDIADCIQWAANLHLSCGLDEVPSYITESSLHSEVQDAVNQLKSYFSETVLCNSIRADDDEESAKPDSLIESLSRFINEVLPGFAADPKSALEPIVQWYEKPSELLHQLNLVSISDSMEDYRGYASMYGHVLQIASDAYPKVKNALIGYDVSRSYFTVTARVRDICTTMDKTFLPADSKLGILLAIQKNWKKLQSKSLKYPVEYLSKIVEKDSKTYREQGYKKLLTEVLEKFSASTSILQCAEQMMEHEHSTRDIGTECGFLLPFSRYLMGDTRNILVVNATPAFIQNWKTDYYQRVTFTVRGTNCKIILEQEFHSHSFIMESALSKYQYADSAVLFGNGRKVVELLHYLEMFIEFRYVPKTITVLTGQQFQLLAPQIPLKYKLTELYILPTDVFHGKNKKKVIAVFTADSDADDVPVYSLTTKKWKNKQYVMTDHLEFKMIPIDKLQSGQSPRALLRIYSRASNPTDCKRAPAVPYQISREITVFCQASDNPDGTKKVKVYLHDKSFPLFPVASGKIIPGTNVTKKRISPEQLTDWIQNEAVFHAKLRNIAVAKLKAAPGKRRLSLKTIYYCIYDKLEDSSEILDLFRYTIWNGSLGQLIVGEADTEQYEDALEEFAATAQDTSRLKQILQQLFEQGVRNRLITAQDANPVIHQFIRELKAEQAVRSLARRNYTAEEEGRMVAYLTGAGRAELGYASAMGALIMLLTGLAANLIQVLKWADFVKISYTNYYKLLICKRATRNQTIEYFQDEVKCRQIPIMSYLRDLLLEFRSQQQITEDDMQSRILLENNQPLSVKKLTDAYRKAEEAAGISVDEVQLASSGKKIDLSKYYGNRARSNFEYHCQTDCLMTEAELDYLKRNHLPDTLNRHYVDQSFVCRQECMVQKLDRWGQRYLYPEEVCQTLTLRNGATTCSVLPGSQHNVAIIIQFSLDGSADLESSFPHGFRYQIYQGVP